MVLEGGDGSVWAMAFHPDRKVLFDGTRKEIRRWHVADRQELGKQAGMDLNVISVSRDHQWVVCGSTKGASVWDEEIQKVVTVEDGKPVYAVDIAPDCTKFATGTSEEQVTIWSITTGEKLVGPLKHGGDGVRFSPDGGRLV